jgi:hypothetical protein
MAVFVLALLMIPAGVRIITPIGPFCFIRSSAYSPSVDSLMTRMSEHRQSLTTQLARLKLDEQFGQAFDAAGHARLGDELMETGRTLRAMAAKLPNTDDFQTREFYMLIDCHLRSIGCSLENFALAMEWQAVSMRAIGEGKAPPPPPDIDLEHIYGGGGDGGLMCSLSMPPMDATPIVDGSRAFESELVRDEYDSIVREHTLLIRLGERFGAFDPSGQLSFIDAIDAIERRWEVFYQRFNLMGLINPRFIEQTNAFLDALGLKGGADEMAALIRQAHDRMREAAQAQLDRGV